MKNKNYFVLHMIVEPVPTDIQPVAILEADTMNFKTIFNLLIAQCR